MRTSTLRVRSLPTRRSSPSCSTRSSLACMPGDISPTSSRNSVPPSATSNRPRVSRSAPVNAPRTWPNSVDSSSVSGMAAQFSPTNGRSRRGPLRVDRARDQLLAGAALALDDDRQRRVGDAIEQPEQIQHARRPTDDVAVVVADGERLAVVAQLLLDARQLLAAAPPARPRGGGSAPRPGARGGAARRAGARSRARSPPARRSRAPAARRPDRRRPCAGGGRRRSSPRRAP